MTGGLHHLNYAQKVFEVGENSTLGITMWGMGQVGDLAHRTLIAQFADDLASRPGAALQDVAERFSQRFYAEYCRRLSQPLERFRELAASEARGLTPEQQAEYNGLRGLLSGGYCIGGHLLPSRTPAAFQIAYGPDLTAPPDPQALRCGSSFFWGCPNIIERVLFGWDEALFHAVAESDKWKGTKQDLFDLIWQRRIAQPSDLPLREAVDWVHGVIYTTIKAMKFSHYSPICGGPIEIAVISTDRPFRWVRHKRFDEAL